MSLRDRLRRLSIRDEFRRGVGGVVKCTIADEPVDLPVSGDQRTAHRELCHGATLIIRLIFDL
jgi:hypothetical protein